jgi:hypothetical protein
MHTKRITVSSNLQKYVEIEIIEIIIPPLPEGGGGILFYLCPSFRPSKKFFGAFFSVTVVGRNLIFGHKHHIGITYMTLVTKYQISVINSCWEKCDEKCAYMFNEYKDQLSRQTGSWNLTGPKTLPTIWYTYMMLVTKYQISANNSYWEKCAEKFLGRTEGRTEVKQYNYFYNFYFYIFLQVRRNCYPFGMHLGGQRRMSVPQYLLLAEIWYLVTSII